MISSIGVVELQRLSIEPLRVKYYSDRSKVGEIDRPCDWDSHLIAGNNTAVPQYPKEGLAFS